MHYELMESFTLAVLGNETRVHWIIVEIHLEKGSEWGRPLSSSLRALKSAGNVLKGDQSLLISE